MPSLRARIGKRITTVLPGQTGEIAAALTVGQTAGLDETSDERFARLRASPHVISISGLHMSLVAGTVFWFLRWSLALFPSIALRFSARAMAGGAALICVTDLSRALGRGHRGGALLHHDRGRVPRDPAQPAGAVACATSRWRAC